MAAPTKPAGVKKVLANPEPSTHGTFRPIAAAASRQQLGLDRTSQTLWFDAIDPSPTFGTMLHKLPRVHPCSPTVRMEVRSWADDVCRRLAAVKRMSARRQ